MQRNKVKNKYTTVDTNISDANISQSTIPIDENETQETTLGHQSDAENHDYWRNIRAISSSIFHAGFYGIMATIKYIEIGLHENIRTQDFQFGLNFILTSISALYTLSRHEHRMKEIKDASAELQNNLYKYPNALKQIELSQDKSNSLSSIEKINQDLKKGIKKHKKYKYIVITYGSIAVLTNIFLYVYSDKKSLETLSYTTLSIFWILNQANAAYTHKSYEKTQDLLIKASKMSSTLVNHLQTHSDKIYNELQNSQQENELLQQENKLLQQENKLLYIKLQKNPDNNTPNNIDQKKAIALISQKINKRLYHGKDIGENEITHESSYSNQMFLMPSCDKNKTDAANNTNNVIDIETINNSI